MFDIQTPTNQPLAQGSKLRYWFPGRMADAVFEEVLLKISKVAGKSSYGVDVAQGNSVQQPTWDGILNGRTVPNWYGPPNVCLEKIAPTGFSLGNYTVIGAASHTFGASDGRIITHRDWIVSSQCIFDIHIKGFAAPDQGALRIYDGTLTHKTAPGVILSGVPFIFTMLLEQGQPVIIRVNGVDVSPSPPTAYAPTSATGRFTIGCFGAEELIGLLPEVLIFDGILEGHHFGYIERYLNNYYNIF